MEQPHLELLLLTDEELCEARKQVEEMAYYKWLDAGCPPGTELDCWREAELEWVELFYVPDRNFALNYLAPR